jgi:cytochrome P450
VDSTVSTAPTARSGPPTLPSRPLIGLWPEMRRDTLGLLTRAAELGDVGGFRLGPRTAAVVSGPEPIHDILIDHPQDFEKGRFLLRVLRPVLGEGLLVSEGDLHTRQRRLIAPTLGSRRIRRYVDWIVQETDRTILSWADGSSIDVLSEINALAMNIIGRILFGTTMRDESRLSDAVTAAFEWEMNALTSPIAVPPAIPTPGNRRMRTARSYVRTRIQELIDERGGDDDSLLTRLATATSTAPR